MRHRVVILVGGFVLLWTGLLVTAGIAQSLVVPLSAEQLCDHSQTIVVATVGSTKAWWTGTAEDPDGDAGTIMTTVHLRVLEVLKGVAQRQLALELLGGRVGRTLIEASETPTLRHGQHFVIFLDQQGALVGGHQGALRVSDGQVVDWAVSLESFVRRVAAKTRQTPHVMRASELRALRRVTPDVQGSWTATSFGRAKSGRGANTPKPVITSMSPAQGSAGTNTQVTIRGTGFGNARGASGRVQFTVSPGAFVGAPIVSWSDTRVVCTVPVVATYNPGGDNSGTMSAGSGPILLRNRWLLVGKGPSFGVTFGYAKRKWAQPLATYRINPNTFEGSAAFGMVSAAARTWNEAGSAFTFEPEGDGLCTTTAPNTNDGHNDIFWGSVAGSDTIAQTLTRCIGKDNVTIAEFDIIMNDRFGWGSNDPAKKDIQTIALHELGHGLGLADLYGASDVAKVMYGIRPKGVPTYRTLDSGDVAGIQWIYPQTTPLTDAHSFAFVDSQRGWRSTFEGDSATGGRAFLWTTDDGGTSWDRILTGKPGFNSGAGYNSGLLAFASPSVGLWGRYGPTLLRTSDGGGSWKEAQLPQPAILWDFAFASKRVAWAATGIGSDDIRGDICKSTDGGATWQTVASIRPSSTPGEGPGGAFHSISCPTESICYVAASGPKSSVLWATTNGGQQWVQQPLPGSWRVLAFPSQSIGWNCAWDGRVFKTSDGGRTWGEQTVAGGALYDASFVDDQHGWLVGEGSTIIRTADGGTTWVRLNSGMNADFEEVVFVDSSHGWVAGTAGTWPNRFSVQLRTVDGGKTWERL